MKTRVSTIRCGAPLILLVAAVTLLYALFPGRFNTDSAWMYAQSANRHTINDWHSPLLTVFMAAARAFVPGPAILFVVQLVVWNAGLGLVVDALIRSGRPISGAALLLACLTPLVSFIFIEVNKDTAMAAVGMALIAILLSEAVREPKHRPVVWLLAAALALVFLGMRVNAFIAFAPLLAAYVRLLVGPRRTGRWAAVSLGLLLTFMAADYTVKYVIIGASRSHTVRALAVFDIAGIAHYSGAPVGADLLGPEFPRRAEVCYTPKAQDPFEWGPCKDYGARLAALTATSAGRKVVYVAWFRAVAGHPLSYARHRLAAFEQLMRFGCSDCAGTMTGGVFSKRPWRIVPVERVTPLARAMNLAANALYRSDLARGALWAGVLIVALGLLAVVLRDDAENRFAIAGAGIAASGLLHALAMAVIGVASAQRYLHWTIMMGAIALPMSLAAAAPVLRRRWRDREGFRTDGVRAAVESSAPASES